MVLTEVKNIPSLSLLLNEKFGVSMMNSNGILIYVNRNFCELSGFYEEELINSSYELLNPALTITKFITRISRELEEQTVVQKKIKRYTKDGKPYWVSATIVPVYDDYGFISKFISIDTDITKRELTNQRYQETLVSLNNIENALNQSSVVAITNRQGVITYVNDKFCELSKYSSEELIGKTHRIVNSGYHPKTFFQDMWNTISSGKIWQGDIQNRAKDDSTYWVNTTIVPFLDNKGVPYQYIAIRSDITARKEAEHSLSIALKNDFQQTVKNLHNAIFKYTLDNQRKIIFTMLEGKITEHLGLSLPSLNTSDWQYRFSKQARTIAKRNFIKSFLGTPTQFELDYSHHTFLIYLSPIIENGNVLEVVGTAIDITERKKAEKLVENMAYYDYLTDLPNRRYFQQKVNEAIEKVGRKHAKFAILFMDLDRFKSINDSMGHYIGDQLLKAVGDRLRSCIRKDDIVARLSGDEFIIMLSPSTPNETEAVAARIVDEVAKAFTIQNLELFVAPSIGISMYPKDGTDYDSLVRNADLAMYLAKKKGNCTYQFFTQELQDNIIERTLLEMELRQAISKDQLTLHYQPQFDLKTGQIKGVEALVRWIHPEKGFISPGEFIPIAEETGLIFPIGHWVLRTACKQAKKWQDDGFPPIRMSVNVSIQQFNQPSFIQQVKDTLAETKLNPNYLTLEITESMTSDVNHCQFVLKKLRDAGIHVSIDDFGTGYSSLSYLSKLPITHLKIDQAFVQDLNPVNTAIVKTIIDLAKNLNLHVIAEGVETEDQAQFLKTFHCDEVQGYYYSKPVSEEEITKNFYRWM